MLEHAYYSVISPEGCAGILWKSHTFKEQAAEALKMTSKDLIRLGVIDDVIREPLGGAHRDHHLMASRLKIYLRGSSAGIARKADQSAPGRPLSEVPPHGRFSLKAAGRMSKSFRPQILLSFLPPDVPPYCTESRAGDYKSE